MLFTSHHIEGIAYVNIGTLLANAIESFLLNRHLPLIANEAIEKIIENNVSHNSEIGYYIAIHDIGILFEPTLQLDLHAKFSAWSRAYTLIIDYAEGTIKDHVFYLAGAFEQPYSINLSDIFYNTI